MVNVERLGDNSVRLSADGRESLLVCLEEDVWKVEISVRGARAGELGPYATAEDAVASATAYLKRGKDELDSALESHGL